jgi:triosephosphate isomerase
MRDIFVNLKRFDVPRRLGGVCPVDDPVQWIEHVIDECVRLGIGRLTEARVTLFIPEALLANAICQLRSYAPERTAALAIGCQGVFREDVTPGGNFGAFTANRPATAMKNLGCDWAMIGHSEERRDKLGMIAKYDPAVLSGETQRIRAQQAVDSMLNAEVHCALKAGLRVLLCVGETAAERGDGDFDAQKPRIEAVLRRQLKHGLKGIAALDGRVAIGYEPIWAIGPGKVPPGAEYINFVAGCIKKATLELYGFEPQVVYGGGLKAENAGMIGSIATIDGGLVALTRFSGEIGFYPEELRTIIDKYIGMRREA